MNWLFSQIIIFKARFKQKIKTDLQKKKAYVKKLIFPIKLFPLKLLVYFIYYLVRIFWIIFYGTIKTFFRIIIWPFRKWKNFFQTIIWFGIVVYVFFSLMIISDYIYRNYGSYSKFWCVEEKDSFEHEVVRIISAFNEGSGFFIAPDQIVTSFHIIKGDPNPKVIMHDGKLVVPVEIKGNESTDVAILYLSEQYPEKVMNFVHFTELVKGETLYSVGYAMGSDLKGDPTILRGRYLGYRQIKGRIETYVQADISLAPGMSGGPLVDGCGKVVGINTLRFYGTSFFVSMTTFENMKDTYTDSDVAKIQIDLTTPEGAVSAFYNYLKVQKKEDAFKLLSKDYVKNTNFEEWADRFANVLDMTVHLAKLQNKRSNNVFVKFTSKKWENNELSVRYYEGTWETVWEEGIYKLKKSNIKEVPVSDIDWRWFYKKE
ncbi:MAG: serine protease [Patescibacteria group bacterium]|nr:serine protease [Patescibacteria group bacterium]